MRARSTQTIPAAPLLPRPMAFTWLLLTLVAVIMPHILHVPRWIALAAFCLWGYRLLHDHLRWRLPPRWLVTLLAFAAIFGIVTSFGTFAGRRPAIAGLVILLALKLLETRSHREVMILICIGYFLVSTNFFYSQSPGMVVYLIVVVWLLTASLMHFQHLGDINSARLRLDLRHAGLLLVQALPLMVMLFIFFPRFNGALWSVPEDGTVGVTGLSETMSPGQITQLSTSAAVAFRVDFDADLPPPEAQYWRGLVLWDFDGYTWRPGEAVPNLPLSWEEADTLYTYTVTLEPHDKRWLFSLDLPYALVRDGQPLPFMHAGYYRTLGQVTSDLQLRAIRPVSTIRRYTLQSYVRYHTGVLSDGMRQRALQLPVSLDVRVRQLAQQWRQMSRDDQDVVRRALDYFRDQNFVYTLAPPALHNNPSAEFLFHTRRGYCEHFASSFTVLMRAAGIPARVVVGYQGGEVNPWGNYLTVLQGNAHAWSEVWLAQHGWVRVDPTTMVAPERIERGLEALPGFSPTPPIIRHYAWLSMPWRTIRLSWDAVQHTWNRWVLQYSAERQRQLMQYLGLGKLTWQGLTIVLGILLSMMLVTVAFCILRQHTPHDRVVRLYQRFCGKLARRGLPRRAHEGPFAFAQRVQQQRPELAQQVHLIAHLYSTLRYGQHRRHTDLQHLQHAVRTFRP